MNKQKAILAATWLLLLLPTALRAEEMYLLPVDAVREGWDFNPDLGWSYVKPQSNGDFWIWVPTIDYSTGRWIYTSTKFYPKFWDTYLGQWQNINSCEYLVYRRMSPYVLEMSQDYLTGNSFRAIEPYVQTEGSRITLMKAKVSFLENNELTYSHSDIVGSGIWSFVRGRILTDVRFIGDNLLYNPQSQILFLNSRKYMKL